VYERFGYWFRTPEAWDEHGQFRASMYMRPGSVWSMEMLTEPTARPVAFRGAGSAEPDAKTRR